MAENYFGITDTGKMRTNNEDTFIAQPVLNDQFIAACVIDGVGGYEGGEVAARLAHDAILDRFKSKVNDYIKLMKEAIAAANEAIYTEKKVSRANEQMACVLTVALADIANNKFYYCHVGDTRLYLFRDNSLVKITRDHSFVGFLEDSGRLTEEAAMRHPKRNEINKALGFDSSIKGDDYIETGESPFLPGDTILLCSDGLSDMIGNSAMVAILDTTKSLSVKAKALVDAANAAGGKDNITVVLVQNNKSPLMQTATKPAVNIKKNESQDGYDILKNTNSHSNEKTAIKNRKRSSIGPFLIFLSFLILVAFLWILYSNYSNKKTRDEEVRSAIVVKERNPEERQFVDSINGNTTKEVFVLNTPDTKAIVITDSILIKNDSLHIIGNGVTLISDSTYKGAAFTMAPDCKYLLLDSLTLENFDIGVLTKTSGLHLKNVQFKNCRVPVQYNFLFKDRPVINGRFADTAFYNLDSIHL
ncbi:protein phosphatase 2C domain-containing protein [Segetibacter sp.]|jgi:serine/threonine protein phosphatase PrpC|uniref:PP2C family protein-serine/threonine phosphatase n=1 Tax=Segetibacter sp. TaxID=2231182 RepID=UPI002619EF8B|nr:protein phosphatase 2C domain-containing protein [Segetibacter sp.]MCW3081415.1 serine/threonine-protein phosphatase [Segetibacter sp.]